jgi:hypothetical protein
MQVIRASLLQTDDFAQHWQDALIALFFKAILSRPFRHHNR